MTDPYTWPDASCLKNKLGITDPAELAKAEARIVSIRDVQLAREPLPGEYNLPHLQRFHWFLFRDIYDWAGRSRTVDIAKDGVPFCSWRFLDDEVSAVLRNLARDRWLLNLAREDFVDLLAFHYGELNARHPFREGNGRTQRAFLRQISAAAGWRLEWSGLNKESNTAASKANLISADHTQLATMLDPIVTRI